MKKRVQPFFIILAFALAITSCNDKEKLYHQEYDFSINHNNQLYKIETKNGNQDDTICRAWGKEERIGQPWKPRAGGRRMLDGLIDLLV